MKKLSHSIHTVPTTVRRLVDASLALIATGASQFSLMIILTLTCVLATSLPALTLTVQSTEKQMLRYGLDFERLWYWYGPQANLNQCAQWAVVDCDVEYLRVAINCGYELEEGVYDLSAYTKKIIPMMTAMKAANPTIKFFASPRPLNEALDGARWQPYPKWITGDNGSSFNFDWQKCAEYLVRYVQLMNSYGFSIDYLDITNEWNYVQPRHVKYIRLYMIDQLGDKMPLIVAPSAWSFSEGVSWLNWAKSQNVLSGFQIASCHNTGKEGTPQDFAETANQLGKEVWDSEVHGWKGSITADEISTSYQMFDRIRAGFTGLDTWLAIGTTKQKHCFFLNNGSSIQRNVKYYIFRKLTNTSQYGYALDIDQPADLTSTAALIKDNRVTVWILNNNSAAVPDVEIVLNDKSIVGSTVTYTKWNADLSISGVNGTVNKSASNRFNADIDANTLYCFEMTVSDGNSPFTGIPHAIPGQIEAEAYDLGGDGVAWYDTTPGNSGGAFRSDDVDITRQGTDYFVSSTAFGEWLEYTVNVTSGNYDLKLNVATIYDNQQVVLKLDDNSLVTVNIPNTHSLSNFQTVTVSPIELTDGTNRILQVLFPFGGVNLDWIAFTPVPTNAFTIIEAEDFCDQYGIDTEVCDEGGMNIGWIHNDDWCAYCNIDFDRGADGFLARVSSKSTPGSIEIRLDSLTGPLLGTCPVSSTGNWQNWVTQFTSLTGVRGVHDIYLVYKGASSGYLFNVNWVTFIPAAPGDLTYDRLVTLDDWRQLSSSWLFEYDMEDLLELVNHWLDGTP